jgi:GNAT superfamily N-acetyltransferase
MTDLDRKTLLAAYNRLRVHLRDPLPAPATAQWDGPLLRLVGLDRDGFLTYSDLGGLEGAELDALIARQRDHFTALGTSVEWKLHGHDLPADLPDRLVAAGFVPEEQETVVVGPVAGLAATQPVTPPGVRLREVRSRADMDRIADLVATVWGSAPANLAERLVRDADVDAPDLAVVVAEADGEVVSAAWVRFMTGTGFATLWGGSTLEPWRRKGIYRALVTYRARLAHARGLTLLQVDASGDSRPVLERLGFVAITTTTPYIFTP